MELIKITESMGRGVITIPENLWYGLKRAVEFYSSESEKEKIEAQNYRAYVALINLLKYGVYDFNSPLERLIREVIYFCFNSLPEKDKVKLVKSSVEKIVNISSKFYINSRISKVISRRLTDKIAANCVNKWLYRNSVKSEFTELAIIGLLEKAGEASDRLKCSFPRLWQQLALQDLDMLYYIVEKPMSKYLEVVRNQRWKNFLN